MIINLSILLGVSIMFVASHMIIREVHGSYLPTKGEKNVRRSSSSIDKPFMKQSAATKPHSAEEDGQNLELIKAVAQAWHAQTGNPKPAMEFDVQRGRSSFKPRPTRFRLEAISTESRESSSAKWNFAESLLDSYEIVMLSRKLEAGLLLDRSPAPAAAQLFQARARKRRRYESRYRLRSLFSKVSTKRVSCVDIPREGSE